MKKPILSLTLALCGCAGPPPATSLTGVVLSCDRGRVDVELDGGKIVSGYADVGCAVFAKGGAWHFRLYYDPLPQMKEWQRVKP